MSWGKGIEAVQKETSLLGMTARSCNLSIQLAEAGGFPPSANNDTKDCKQDNTKENAMGSIQPIYLVRNTNPRHLP